MKDEFSSSAIPAAERQAAWKVAIVSLGLTVVSVDWIVGGVIGTEMAPGAAYSAIVVGGLILAAMASYTAYFSHKTGRTFALQMPDIFGAAGSRVVSCFVGLIILGWYTIQASLLGHAAFMQFGAPGANESWFLVVTPLVLSASALAGFTGLTIFKFVSLPAMLLLSVMAITSGAPAEVPPAATGPELKWDQALTMVISLWMMGAVATIGDVTRFARTPRAAVISAAVAFIVGDMCLMLVGAWCTYRFGIGDPSELLRKFGAPTLGLALLAASIWSTNENAIYSTGLNFAHATKVPLRILIVLAAIIAAIVSLYRPYESSVISGWLTALGVVVPPLGGAIIGRRMSGLGFPPANVWLAICGGVGISLVGVLPLTPLWGLGCTAVLVPVLDRLVGQRFTLHSSSAPDNKP